MRTILASASPRRKELLKNIISNFEVIVSDVEEKIDDNLTEEEKAQEISYLKAKAVFDNTEGDRIVIGADTMVVKDNNIYGKPKNRDDAKRIIKELLQGDRSHKVITGLTVIAEKNGNITEYKTFEKSIVYLNPITDKEIEAWIDTGKAMDKAGAYAIQEEFCRHIKKVDGDYPSIIGLPVSKLYDILKNI